MIIDQGGEQIVCGTNCVKIAGKVKIDVFHGHDLGIASPRRPAFHSETGSKTGFAKANHRFFTNAGEAVAQSNGGGCFAFTGWCRSHCCDQYQAPRRRGFDLLDAFQ